MKKTLLVAMATLAAGIISIQAQVYSQNIVGYVNVACPAGFVAAGSPLQHADGQNSATNVLPNIPDLSYLYVWNTNNFTYDVYLAYQGQYYDSGGNNVVATPNLPIGLGYYIQAPTAYTNTFVGTVAFATNSGVSGTISTNNMNLVAGFNFVNTQLPVGGGVTSNLQMTPPDLTYVYVFNVTNQSYDVSLSYQGAWYDSGGNFTVPEPVVGVGSAFFVQPPTPFTWSMVYTNQ